MKRIGTISYNIYCNFTNYGSALQTWALHQVMRRIGYIPVLVDYCPDVLADKDPLNPYKNMWDQDEESKRMCELTMPAIRENYFRFEEFYTNRFYRTPIKYTSSNFNTVIDNEALNGFICGSDTIFCIDEFGGFDDGYYANYECMRGNAVAYAASFGDSHFRTEDYQILDARLKNFKAIGLRENAMIPYVSSHTIAPVRRVIDPTLLLTAEDYDTLATDRLENGAYLLLYTRRYNPAMEKFAETLADENGWKIIEISLRAENARKANRRMFYEAGVEEFLSLVKHAQFVVTNSFHGVIFSVLYRRPFYVFSREQCDSKIKELLQLSGLEDCLFINADKVKAAQNNYDAVHERILSARKESIEFLKEELKLL